MIQLSDVVRELRRELNSALTDGEDEAVRFELGQVEIEATVAVDRSEETAGKVRFWVMELGGSGTYASSETQRITLTLQPKVVGEDGVARTALIAGGEVDGER